MQGGIPPVIRMTDNKRSSGTLGNVLEISIENWKTKCPLQAREEQERYTLESKMEFNV